MTNISHNYLLRRSSLAVLLSLLVGGCSTTQVLQPVTEPTNEKALVYFIRKSYPPYVRELRVNLNNTVVATIANNDYVAVNVPVGENEVLLEVNDGKTLSFEMPIEEPGRIYVVLTGEVRKTGSAVTGYREFTVYLNWNLRAYAVNRSEAELLVAEFGKVLK